MQQMPAKRLQVCHTFKVRSRLTPDTCRICFRDGESLKEPESNLYGLRWRKETDECDWTEQAIEEGVGLEEYQDVGKKEVDDVQEEGIEEEELVSS
jgi:hypothetical protein